MKNEYLQLAKIVATHGLRGEVKVYTTSSFSELRYKKNSEVYLKINDEYHLFHINTFRKKDMNFDIISFNEINDINEAEKLKNIEIFVKKDLSILKNNEYYYDDLLSLEIVDENNNIRGKVVKIEEFPAQLTLKVETSFNKYAYIPFIDVFIKRVDLENKKIYINTIKGLL